MTPVSAPRVALWLNVNKFPRGESADVEVRTKAPDFTPVLNSASYHSFSVLICMKRTAISFVDCAGDSLFKASRKSCE